MLRRFRFAHLVSVLVLACAMTGAAWSATGPVTPAQRPDWPAAAVHALSQRPTADAQATAAVLAYEADNYGDGHPSLAQLQQLELAAKLAPRAPDLATLSMLWCSDMPSHCNVMASADDLQQLAPDNSIGWLPALQTDVKEKRTAAVTATLQRMAAAGHFSLYIGEWMRRIDAVLQTLPPPGTPMPVKGSDGGQLWQAGFASRLLFPPNFRALLQACSRLNPAFPDRRDACRAVGGQLKDSDGYSAVLIGLALLRHTASTASAYRQALDATVQWRWMLNEAVAHSDPYRANQECVAVASGCAHAWNDLANVMRAEGHSTVPPANSPTGIRISEFTQHADEKAGVPRRFLVTHDYAAYLRQWCRRWSGTSSVSMSGCPRKSPA